MIHTYTRMIYIYSITMYDQLKYHGVKEGTCVAIVGCGGLGQMGIKLAKVCMYVVCFGVCLGVCAFVCVRERERE